MSSETSATLLVGALPRKRQPCAALLSVASASAAFSWMLCETFCSSVGINASQLDPTRDPIPLLRLYAHRYRCGTLAPGRRPVRSRTVEDAIPALSQAYDGMGTPDPRLKTHGHLNFSVASMYPAWQLADNPPLGQAAPSAPRRTRLPLCSVGPARHLAECLVAGFYFLLRPGEYLGLP